MEKRKGTPNGTEAQSWRFGSFDLELDRGTLLREGREVPLRRKSFAVLQHLVANHGRLISKKELLASVWGHTYVTEGSLTQCIIDIRRALGDDTHEWVRTVTGRGYVFEADVRESEASAAASASDGSRRRRLAGIAGPLIGLLTVLFVVGWYAGGALWKWNSVASGPPENTIAVLPFDDMSADRGQEYFAEGMAEEVIDALTHIPGLRVIARTSSFSFKESRPDIRTVGDKLNVAHIIEGSVRKSGNRVRITVQLVDAEANTHIWSKTFDRTLDDVFAIQSEIARSVAKSLQMTLAERRVESISPPHRPEAYEHFLQGRYFWHRRDDGDVERARHHYTRAVAIDPRLARAWVGLAGVYVRQRGNASDREAVEKKIGITLHRALESDPTVPEAHVRLSGHYGRMGNTDRAQYHWKKALSLGPDNWLVTAIGAIRAIHKGNYERAVTLQEKAFEINPLSSVTRQNGGIVMLAAGRYEEAEENLLKAAELNPGVEKTVNRNLLKIRILQNRHREVLDRANRFDDGHHRDRALAIVRHAIGKPHKADQALERLKARPDRRTPFRVAGVYAQRGNIETAFDWLARLDPPRIQKQTRDRIEHWHRLLRFSPFLQPLRNDPRWEPLIAELSDQPFDK